MKKQVYTYKDKLYSIVKKSKINDGGEWKSVIIYKCEYYNPDGMEWVRFENDFFDNFVLVESIHVCRYSKAMNQPYPMLCIDCGEPEKVNYFWNQNNPKPLY